MLVAVEEAELSKQDDYLNAEGWSQKSRGY